MSPSLRWLGVSAGLAVLAALLFSFAPQLSHPVEVTVCNRMTAQALEQVEVQLVPGEQNAPRTQLGGLEPDQCHTTPLPARGEASVRIAYRVRGVQFMVHDPQLEYVEGGYRTVTEVQGAGATESDLGFPEPDPREGMLVVALMAALSGALAALLVAAWLGLRRLFAAASRARPPA